MLLSDEVESITLNKKTVEMLLWKIANLEAQCKLFTYSCYGAGWDGYDAKPISKKALLRAAHYLSDLVFLSDIPASTTLKDGSIWFEDEDGGVHAICTTIGTLITDRKEINKYLGKTYGK